MSIYRPFYILGHSLCLYDSFHFTPILSVPCCFTLQTSKILISVAELCNMFEDLCERTCGFDIPHEEGFFENIADPWNVKWRGLFDNYKCFRGT